MSKNDEKNNDKNDEKNNDKNDAKNDEKSETITDTKNIITNETNTINYENQEKTTNIINSINSIVIPNINNNSGNKNKENNLAQNTNVENNTDQNSANQNKKEGAFNDNTKENNLSDMNNDINANSNYNNQNYNPNMMTGNYTNINNINNQNNTNNMNNAHCYYNNYQNNYINNNSIKENSTEANNNSNNNNKNNNQNNNLLRKKSSGEKKKGMKDFAFKFPLANSFSKVEIPFAFQQNLEEANNSRFHSYITIKDTPKLYIDISDDQKMDKFKLSSTIESLKVSNQKQETKLQSIDTNIMKLNNDNDLIRDEIAKIKNEIMMSNNKIDHLKNTIDQINQNEKKFDQEMKQKISDKNNLLTYFKEKYDKIFAQINEKKNNITETEKKELLSQIKDEIIKIHEKNQNIFKYYSIKYSNNLYSDEYIKKSLQKDLLDFCKYVTMKTKAIVPKVKELIKFIQSSVDNSISNEYEVKLYGSHATGLCLPWSDIDVVICKKNGEPTENYYIPLHELYTYLQNKNNNDFIKTINFIGTTSIPLIKIKTQENTGIQRVDISLQDKGHYGLKCVSLVLSYKEEYEVLLPMILALKNILKQANLNDPYKVSININIYI